MLRGIGGANHPGRGPCSPGVAKPGFGLYFLSFAESGPDAPRRKRYEALSGRMCAYQSSISVVTQPLT